MAATGTATSTEKGRRIVGAERQTLAKDLVKRYTSGESIRALAASTGRSYGFVHRVLTESGVQLRQRGGARRRKKREASNRRQTVRASGIPPMNSDSGVRLESDGPVATVTLCRPDVLNAQTPDMWRALHNFSRELTGDVRVVLVKGEGRAFFSAGLDRAVLTGTDFTDLAALPDDEAADRIAFFQQAFTWLRRPDLITIAAVQGTRSAPVSNSPSTAICESLLMTPNWPWLR